LKKHFGPTHKSHKTRPGTPESVERGSPGGGGPRGGGDKWWQEKEKRVLTGGRIAPEKKAGNLQKR